MVRERLRIEKQEQPRSNKVVRNLRKISFCTQAVWLVFFYKYLCNHPREIKIISLFPAFLLPLPLLSAVRRSNKELKKHENLWDALERGCWSSLFSSALPFTQPGKVISSIFNNITKYVYFACRAHYFLLHLKLIRWSVGETKTIRRSASLVNRKLNEQECKTESESLEIYTWFWSQVSIILHFKFRLKASTFINCLMISWATNESFQNYLINKRPHKLIVSPWGRKISAQIWRRKCFVFLWKSLKLPTFKLRNCF